MGRGFEPHGAHHGYQRTWRQTESADNPSRTPPTASARVAFERNSLRYQVVASWRTVRGLRWLLSGRWGFYRRGATASGAGLPGSDAGLPGTGLDDHGEGDHG